VNKPAAPYRALLATVRSRAVAGMVGFVQSRNDTPGRACYRRSAAEGNTAREALRCLRRRLPDAGYRQLAAGAHPKPPGPPS
jgi:transposase